MANSSVPASGGSGPAIDVETIATGAGTVNRPIGIIGSPTVGGQRMEVDNHSSAQVKLYDAAGNPLLVNPGDGQAATDMLAVAQMEYNSVSWDRRQNANQAITLLPLAARVQTVNVPIVGYGWSGYLFAVNVTAVAATGNVQFSVWDATVSAELLAATAAISATGFYMYLVSDGSTTTAPVGTQITQLWQIPLPGQCRLAMLHGNGVSLTYSVVAYPIKRA